MISILARRLAQKRGLAQAITLGHSWQQNKSAI
jgi:hypothetical protein